MATQNATEARADQAPGIPAVQVMEVAQAHSPPPANGPAPEPSPHNLQEVLPEITQLAHRVGGLDKLAELIQTLRGVRT